MRGAMRRSHSIVALVFLVYFVMSFLTNILGPIVPDIIQSFQVSLGLRRSYPSRSSSLTE